MIINGIEFGLTYQNNEMHLSIHLLLNFQYTLIYMFKDTNFVGVDGKPQALTIGGLQSKLQACLCFWLH